MVSEMFPRRVGGFLGIAYGCRGVDDVCSVLRTCNGCDHGRGKVLGTILACMAGPRRTRGRGVRSFLHERFKTGRMVLALERSGSLVKNFVLSTKSGRFS